MAQPSPYELNLSLSDDATFEFSCEWKLSDGSPFPWAENGIEYVLSDDRDCALFTLDQARGSVITAPELHRVTFASATMPRPGRYQHGCRARHLATGKVAPLFDGTVTISEGHFR